MSFLDQACDALPPYFLAASISMVALLLSILIAVLIAVIAGPMNSRVRISEADAMAEPFGDQPDVPSRPYELGGLVDCSKLPRWRP